MDLLNNPLTLSRLQFAVTTWFHMCWPLLSIGLGLFLAMMETLWFFTRKEIYYRQVRFWVGLFLLSFGIGVASGLPLEFQFGTNWAAFSKTAGGFFGNILGFEGAMAFMLEAAFLGIMIFGWKRVSPLMHLFATYMVAFGATLSAFWIMDASSWMQTPAGVDIIAGQAIIIDYVAAVLNPALGYSFSHMVAACLETSAFFVGGISAWCILRGRNVEFFLTSLKAAILLAIVVAPLQFYLGDLSGRGVAKYQPAKSAAMEAHWQTNPPGQGAPWSVVAWPDVENQRNAWQVQIPDLLSVLATHSATGEVKGLAQFPRADQPPIAVPFYCFRAMIVIGSAMLLAALWAAWMWARGRMTVNHAARHQWLLWLWVGLIPAGFIASDLGWTVREVGRQPWIIYNVMRTSDGVSNLQAGPTAATFFLFCGVYLVLLTVFIVFTRRIILKGPDLGSEILRPPGYRAEGG